jgi:hypothetical protein
MLHALLLGLSFSLATATAPRPDRATREAACKRDASDPKYRCYAEPAIDPKLKLNVFYGWNVGMGHPSSDTDPPTYDKLLDGLDQCAWYHDRGAFRWNPRTKVCETLGMCQSAIGLYRCMTRFTPSNAAEARAKEKIVAHIRQNAACVATFYKDYGARFERDPRGSYWLSQKSIAELSEAFTHCKPGMATPGWTSAVAKQPK